MSWSHPPCLRLDWVAFLRTGASRGTGNKIKIRRIQILSESGVTLVMWTDFR